MKVSEIMSTTLTVVEPEVTLGEAATLMGERHVGSVIVCENVRLVGILTERDIVRALSHEHDAPQRPVVEWMTKDPTTTEPGADVKEALRTMIDGGFRHLPVLDGGRVAGMVSIRDVAGAMAD
ncbi:MAG TPA: CBS domain-containing protein [Actinomycetota bacterium]|nr:CBS domain-containing protein [Actinomycetota bacterium]